MTAVADARHQEMRYVHQRRVYKYSTKTECRRITGAAPIRVRWVDTRKGDGIRARFVAMEFRKNWEASIFAGTPPLEALRALIGLAAHHMNDEDPWCILNLNISRARFYAPAQR